MEAGGKPAKGVMPLRDRAMAKAEEPEAKAEQTTKTANKAVPPPPQEEDLAHLNKPV